MNTYRCKAETMYGLHYARTLCAAGYHVKVSDDDILVDAQGNSPEGACWNVQVDTSHCLHFVPESREPVTIPLSALPPSHGVLQPTQTPSDYG